MVNENLIPKVEEVRYLNTEIPSYEEFLRNYKANERVRASYLSEINAYDELGKGYGPVWRDGGGSSSSSSSNSVYAGVGGYGAWRQGMTSEEKERNARETEQRLNSSRSSGLGKTIVNAALLGTSTALLGPFGTVTAGTFLAMTSANLGCGDGFDLGIEMFSEGTVDIVKEVAIKEIVKK